MTIGASKSVRFQMGIHDEDDKETVKRKETVEAVRLAVKSWKIPDGDKRYLLSALITHERMLLHFSSTLVLRQSLIFG
jgi:hypothetical protein